MTENLYRKMMNINKPVVERYIVEIYAKDEFDSQSVGIFPEGLDWEDFHSFYTDEQAETVIAFMRSSIPKELDGFKR